MQRRRNIRSPQFPLETATLTAPEAHPSPGTAFAGYRIERLLGHGGMGTVYLAHDAAGNATALKVMDLGGAEATEMARTFEREVALSRRLDHPGIVRVLNAGRHDRHGFIAMEFIAGENLGRFKAAHRPLPARLALDIAGQIARALAHAHAAGVLHRDIKPANILVEETTSRVKLADFGLARLSDLHRSRTGVLAGTPAYMSPEQLAEGAQDARADLYSLGVVLFELLTGRLPYEAASLGELLHQVSRVDAPPVRLLQPQVPKQLSALVARLLEKAPERRPRDAQTLARETEHLLLALAIQPQPPPPPTWSK